MSLLEKARSVKLRGIFLIAEMATGTKVGARQWSESLYGHIMACRFAQGEGGGTHNIFGPGGVPPGPENPYPISDQNIRIYLPYFIPDSQNVYPISDPVMCGKFGISQ